MRIIINSIIKEEEPTVFNKHVWKEGTMPAISNVLEEYVVKKMCFVTTHEGSGPELNNDKALMNGVYGGIVTRIKLKDGRAELTIDTLPNEEGKKIESLSKVTQLYADFLIEANYVMEDGFQTIDLNTDYNRDWKVYPVIRLVDVANRLEQEKLTEVTFCPAAIIRNDGIVCNNIALNTVHRRSLQNPLYCQEIQCSCCLFKKYLQWTSQQIGKTKKGQKELKQWAEAFKTKIFNVQ